MQCGPAKAKSGPVKIRITATVRILTASALHTFWYLLNGRGTFLQKNAQKSCPHSRSSQQCFHTLFLGTEGCFMGAPMGSHEGLGFCRDFFCSLILKGIYLSAVKKCMRASGLVEHPCLQKCLGLHGFALRTTDDILIPLFSMYCPTYTHSIWLKGA